MLFFFFFFNDTATTEIYTLSLHDALSISVTRRRGCSSCWEQVGLGGCSRSEEHTSELQSHVKLVCRLLLEKKKKSPCLQPGFTWNVTATDNAAWRDGAYTIADGQNTSLRLVRVDTATLFFFNDTATTEIDTLSLHDALPI